MNPAEEAVFIAQLIDKRHLDEAGICKLLHRTPNYIADRLRLLRNDMKVFEALRAGQINYATARELNKCTDETMRRYFLDSAIRSGCASRIVTQWIVDWQNAHATTDPTPAVPVDAGPEPAAEVHWDACAMCGGDKDPYNLISVRVHKWEWEAFLREWRKGMKIEA